MQWILRLRVYIIVFLAVVLIFAAVTFSALRAVLPYATGYKLEIQGEISQQIGLPVEIGSIDAEIQWFSPRLKLLNVVVYDGKNNIPLFNFKEAFVELDVMATILHTDIIVNDVGLIGADLRIEKLSESEWSIQGVKFSRDGSSELPEAFLYMLQNANYLLHDSNIYYLDHTDENLSMNLLDVNIDVKNSFNNHDITFSMNLPDEYGRDLAVVANLSGDLDSLNGDVYVEARQVKVAQWRRKFAFLPEYQLDADLDINIWIVIKDNDVGELTSKISAKQLSLKNNDTLKSWQTNFLSANVRYVFDQDHWNLAVSDFYFGGHAKPVWPRAVTITASDDVENYYLSAEFLRVFDVQEVVQVFLDEKMLSEFESLKAYQLQADIYNLNLKYPKQALDDELTEKKQSEDEQVQGERLQDELSAKKQPDKEQPAIELSIADLLEKIYLQATVVDLSVRDSNSEISVEGLDASILIDDKRVTLDLISIDTTVEVATLFRDPLLANTLQGKMQLSHNAGGWQLSSEKLQLKNEHINSFSRLDITLSASDEVFVDVQTDFYDAYGKYAKFYLPVEVMSPALVKWLEMAVTDGFVPAGQFILHGDLASFPYDANDGVFQVLFSPRDIHMRFLNDWPVLTDASATVKFNNKSLLVSGARAKTQGATLFDGFAEIPDLTDSHLTVKTNARARNVDAQSYIWNSPLDDVLGNAMRLFQFSGESDLNLKIEVPLSDDQEDVAIDGQIRFINSRMYYATLGYEVSNINGVIDFTRDTIFAESLSAKIQDEAVSINAFTRDGESGREVVFHLDGKLSADYLLQNYEWIPQDWIAGKSIWSLDIEVPNKPEDYLIRIKANTDLDGVELQVSDKVAKLTDSAAEFSAEILVLDNNALQIDARANAVDENNVKSGNVFQLYALRDENYVWAVDIDSQYMTGNAVFVEGLAKDTDVTLDLEYIDLHALFVSQSKKESKPLRPVDFPPLNWRFDKLRWNGMVFNDVVLETDWHEHGMLINKLSLKGPAMTFSARGTWLKSWRDTQHTVLQGTMNSSNFGETLAGLGFERSIDRASYKASFNSKWPAEPYALSWANMKGKSSFIMEKGEILDVEPGAGGRLLSMLNIFKLASRLTFDFDDVTRKGFVFDTIKGEFEFVNGAGSLKQFDVTAAAADINIFGSVGLVDQDYGLLMRVKPHTDSLTLAGGILLGGVAVGASLAIIQKVFDLGVIGHNVYSITGSWDDPQIKKIVERTLDTSEEDDDF